MNDRSDLYPSIEPYETGVLEVSDGHRLFYELCGNPSGRPAVFLHGGPGAGCNPTHRRFFDPAVYKLVLFDQRGAGRSTPMASVHENTTAHLVSDIETLRRHLRIDRWVVFGGSWGSTLGLAYAAAHPEACRALVLRGIWLCREIDIDWWFGPIRLIYPEYWQAFVDPIPAAERHDLLGAYLRRLMDPDPAVHSAGRDYVGQVRDELRDAVARAGRAGARERPGDAANRGSLHAPPLLLAGERADRCRAALPARAQRDRARSLRHVVSGGRCARARGSVAGSSAAHRAGCRTCCDRARYPSSARCSDRSLPRSQGLKPRFSTPAATSASITWPSWPGTM